MAVFTLEDEQIIVWHLSVRCEFMSYCRRLVRTVFTDKSSFQTAKYQRICSSKYLFILFAHQTICSSETIRPSSSVKASINWPLYGRFALISRDQSLSEGFSLENGNGRGNFKGEVLNQILDCIPSRVRTLSVLNHLSYFSPLPDYSFEVPSS